MPKKGIKKNREYWWKQINQLRWWQVCVSLRTFISSVEIFHLIRPSKYSRAGKCDCKQTERRRQVKPIDMYTCACWYEICTGESLFILHSNVQQISSQLVEQVRVARKCFICFACGKQHFNTRGSHTNENATARERQAKRLECLWQLKWRKFFLFLHFMRHRELFHKQKRQREEEEEEEEKYHHSIRLVKCSERKRRAKKVLRAFDRWYLFFITGTGWYKVSILLFPANFASRLTSTFNTFLSPCKLLHHFLFLNNFRVTCCEETVRAVVVYHLIHFERESR